MLDLKLEDARFVLSIKLTKLLGGIVFVFLGFMLALCTLAFVSVAIGHLLCNVMHPVWAYLLIALFYLILIGVMVVFKKTLIMDPIARFISKLIVEEPVSTRNNPESHE